MNAWEALFDGVPDHLAEFAVAHFRDVEVASGTVLMEEGDQDPSLIYLLHGGVSIRKNGQQIDVSGPGELIGEMSLFSGHPSRSAQVVTVGDTRALILDTDGYEELIRKANPVAYRIERMALAQLGHRLRRLDGLVSERAEGQPDPYAPPSKGFLDVLRKMFGLGKGSDVEPRNINPVKVLEDSAIFGEERFTLVEAVAKNFRHTVWPQGSMICEQGKAGMALHIIAAGQADIVVSVPSSKRDPKVHRMGTVRRGAAVGMTSLVDGRPRMASVIATEQVDALSLDAETFRHLVGEDSQITSALRRAMIRAFGAQVQEAGANLVAVTRGEVPEYVSAGASMEVFTE